MGVKIKFDSKSFERDLKKAITNDLRKHPEQVLKNHIGENIEATCSECGDTDIEIISGGKAKCNSCGSVKKVDLDIHWK